MKASLADAKAIIRTLESNGYEAYLAGGCVRDLLLGVEPNDYDVTTSAVPDKIKELFHKTIAVGEAFGVIKVVTSGGEIDVATFRIDGQYSDNRRPDSVTYSTSAEEDVKRRDFTINSMLMTADDRVIDYVGGREDLKNRIIRAVGVPEERFREDALRMMRAIRFSMRFHMDIESHTWDAIYKLSDTIDTISIPRFTEELQKTFSYGNYDVAFWMLIKSRIWCNRLGAPNDVLWIMRLLARLPNGISFYVILAVISQAIYIRDKTLLDQKLSLTKEDAKGLYTVYGRSSEMLSFQRYTLSKQRRMMQWPDINVVNALVVARYKCNIGNLGAPSESPQSCTIEALLARQKVIRDMGYPTPLVNGTDLQNMGFIPGPVFSLALEQIHDQYLEGLLTDPAKVREFVLRQFPFIPRKDENGTVIDLMAPVRVMAQCKACSATMSFQVKYTSQGKMDVSSARLPQGCHALGARYAHCSCGKMRKMTGFVRPVGL